MGNVLQIVCRVVGLGLTCAMLAACAVSGAGEPTLASYGPQDDGAFVIEAIRPRYLRPAALRTLVPFAEPYEAGTIVVDTGARYLYLVGQDGMALRYAIGVGREGFQWSGEATIGRKEAWPIWVPPGEMIARQPELAPYRDGMPGGPGNPLGARALYLYQGGRDTLFRLHGTREPWSIGRQVSSGCIRLFNQDIVDLFERVAAGTRVVVLAQPPSFGAVEVAASGWIGQPEIRGDVLPIGRSNRR